MKVLLATPLYPPDVGGPATDSAYLERALPSYGIETSVFSFGAVRHLSRVLRHIRYAQELVKRGRGVDAIVSFDTFSVCLPALYAAWRLSVPLIVRVPGDWTWEQSVQRFGVADTIEAFQTKRYGLMVELFRYLERAAVRHATLVVVPSDFLKRIVSSWGVVHQTLVRIYLGLESREEPVAPTTVPEGRTLFSAGRMVPWKGFAMLVELIHELPAEWHLVIAGDGPERGHLKAQAERLGVQSRVRFLGNIPRVEVLGWCRAADVFVLNTAQETFSFQILEAMAAGAAVITTNVCSTPELITDGVEGVLLTPNDLSAFRQAILSSASEKELWERRRAAAMERAGSFTAAASAATFAEELKKICALS